MLQYHGGSPEKLQVLILAPSEDASSNINATTVHSALGLPCCGHLFPLDSNKLCVFRNKYTEVELIILVEILMLSKIVFYQMHRFA